MSNQIPKVKIASQQTLSEVQQVQTNEPQEVKTAEAQQLEEAKINENTNVGVEIAEPEQKDEKGLFAKIGKAFNAIFSKDNLLGKTLGGSVVGGLCAGLGFILAGPAGAVGIGLLGGVLGALMGYKTQDKIENHEQEVQQEMLENSDNEPSIEYDENGNMTKEIVDVDNDGKPEQIRLYEYDKNNNNTKMTFDRNGDGVPETVTTNEYNANNNITKYTFDRDNDGTIDYSKTYEYNDLGQLSKETSINKDGSIDSIKNYIYDEYGNRTDEIVEDGKTSN